MDDSVFTTNFENIGTYRAIVRSKTQVMITTGFSIGGYDVARAGCCGGGEVSTGKGI